MKYNERGEEVLDTTEVEVPLRFKRPPTLQEQIKNMVRGEISRNAVRQGRESFEEADDFEVDDDELPPSPYEFSDMPIEKIMDKGDASVLDKSKKKEYDGGTVNGDRIKEKDNVQSSGAGDDRKGAGGDGEVSVAAGGKG